MFIIKNIFKWKHGIKWQFKKKHKEIGSSTIFFLSSILKKIMNQDHLTVFQEPIAERQRPGDIPSKPRIQWPKGNQIATM